MKRLQREVITIILTLSAIYIYIHISRSVAEFWSRPVIVVIVLCGYILYHITLSILKLERAESDILLAILLLLAFMLGPYISERFLGHENRLILVLCLMLAYVFHRYLRWILEFHKFGMRNIPLLECLWPPLYERRSSRILDAEIKAEIEAEREQEDKEPDEEILGQRAKK
jgi:hypothetical protein